MRKIYEKENTKKEGNHMIPHINERGIVLVWIVMGLVGIMVSLVAVSESVYEKAQLAAAVRVAEEMRTVRGAMSAYYAQNGGFPASMDVLVSGGFLSSPIVNFMGTTYEVGMAGTNGQIRVAPISAKVGNMVQAYHSGGSVSLTPVGGGNVQVEQVFVPPGNETYVASINAQIDALVAAYSGILPAGSLLLGEGACPGGWPRTSDYDGRFLMASGSAGVNAGGGGHGHDMSPHSHGGTDHAHGLGGYSIDGASPPDNNIDEVGGGWGYDLAAVWHGHSVDWMNVWGNAGGISSGTGSTAGVVSVPPYRGVSTCRKI